MGSVVACFDAPECRSYLFPDSADCCCTKSRTAIGSGFLSLRFRLDGAFEVAALLSAGRSIGGMRCVGAGGRGHDRDGEQYRRVLTDRGHPPALLGCIGRKNYSVGGAGKKGVRSVVGVFLPAFYRDGHSLNPKCAAYVRLVDNREGT